MQCETFYIASPFYNFKAVQKLSRSLNDLGMCWYNNHDWTQFDPRINLDDPVCKEIAESDVLGAINADIFVMLCESGYIARGTWAEFGARIASERRAFVILNEINDHIFFKHRLVKVFPVTKDFLECIKQSFPCKDIA